MQFLSAVALVFLEQRRHETYGTVAVFREPFGHKWDMLQLIAG